MRKLTLAAIAALAAVFLTPALAHAATIRGTVVAKQAHRHVLVVATGHRQVVTARVSAQQLQAVRVGNRLALTGTKLADASLRVTGLRRHGSVRRARLSAVVLHSSGRSLLVAGGGTAFSIRLDRGTRLLASRNGNAHPGEKIDADVELTKNGPVGEEVHATGDAPLIDFSGVVTAMDATSITVTEDGIDTVVQLPDGITLPPIVHVGSEVEIVATISGSTLTLATIKLDDENEQGDDNGGFNSDDQGRVEAEGSVTSIDAGSITIQPGDNASPVTFAIPAGFTLPAGLADGSVVEARGELVNGVLTLKRLELQDQGDGGGDDGGGGGGDG
jgi:hypothetical protein